MNEVTKTVAHGATQAKSPIFPKLAFWGKIKQQRAAKLSLMVLLLISVIGIIGPWIAPYDPTESNYEAFLQGPSAKHVLGTDAIGRDLFSRILYGTRVTLVVAVMAVGITVAAGTMIGVISAYVGGFIDHLLMRIMDILLALPGIILALAIVAALGPSQTNAMIAIGISSIPSFARLIRAATLVIMSSGYVEASRSIGTPSWWIILFQVLPNITNVLFVYMTLFVGGAILDTAALGFIGLGAQPPTPEWGTMLNEGKDYLSDAWWLATYPGLAITIVVLAVNRLGDALRDIFDPRTQK
ncbi:ABC transporter permease [Brevibacillus fortis]|uniref:D-ala-D-ala transporter subunit n=1 Tax=Brevibacillus fortis TaxID=2126352 RepID=A0A2P7V8F4_9BACL|nr:ABC transporter permease [Brevibacillus fortis]MED1783811.1 ABC transporter permease [Brevibacillus fortis]PSJ95490.1 D-ala-D-ala transporter subunit [Brevibacillus fortis]